MIFCSLTTTILLLKLHDSFVYPLLGVINVGIFVVSWIYLVTIKSSIFSVLVVTHLNKILFGSDVLATDVPIDLVWFIGMFNLCLFSTFSRVWSAIRSWIKAFWWILHASTFLFVPCCIILPAWALIIEEVMTRISLCSYHKFHSGWLWFSCCSASLR